MKPQVHLLPLMALLYPCAALPQPVSQTEDIPFLERQGLEPFTRTRPTPPYTLSLPVISLPTISWSISTTKVSSSVLSTTDPAGTTSFSGFPQLPIASAGTNSFSNIHVIQPDAVFLGRDITPILEPISRTVLESPTPARPGHTSKESHLNTFVTETRISTLVPRQSPSLTLYSPTRTFWWWPSWPTHSVSRTTYGHPATATSLPITVTGHPTTTWDWWPTSGTSTTKTTSKTWTSGSVSGTISAFPTPGSNSSHHYQIPRQALGSISRSALITPTPSSKPTSHPHWW